METKILKKQNKNISLSNLNKENNGIFQIFAFGAYNLVIEKECLMVKSIADIIHHQPITIVATINAKSKKIVKRITVFFVISYIIR